MTIEDVIKYLKGIPQPRYSQEMDKAYREETEYPDISSWSGGNYEDAYQIGEDSGEYAMAQQVLELLDKVVGEPTVRERHYQNEEDRVEDNANKQDMLESRGRSEA